MPSAIPSWQAGISYKSLIFRKKGQSLTLSGGFQRWLLPSVKTGAKDWLSAETLVYTASVEEGAGHGDPGLLDLDELDPAAWDHPLHPDLLAA